VVEGWSGGGVWCGIALHHVPRKPREEVEGGVFHVFARGNDRRLIYRDDADRRMYLRMLRGTVRTCRWRLLAYCLMENHVHLLVETPEANLGDGMQRMHGLYAREFNGRHRRSGHVFQGRYGAVRIKTDEQLWMVAVYVAMNPVDAGLCSRPEDRPWSSHSAAVADKAPDWIDVSRLLSHFGSAGGNPRRRYAAMFEADSA
jgi:putative transposase